MRGSAALVVGMLLFLAACSDSADEPATTTAPPVTAAPVVTTTAMAPTTVPPTTVVPTTTVAPTTTLAPTTTAAGPVVSLVGPGDDGTIEVSIDPAGLGPLFDQFQPGDDPFFLVHTERDDLFIGLELYTVFGGGWTGELGAFPADCTTHGICVYLDPDGTGPLPGMGPGEGTLTVEQLEGRTVVTLDDVRFTDDEGQVYAISGLTLGG